jgi:hypothetical protein
VVAAFKLPATALSGPKVGVCGGVHFTIGFVEAFATANYAILATASCIASDGAVQTLQPRGDTSQINAGSCRFNCGYDVSAAGRILIDAAWMSVAFLGDP